jgi:hypothetical protein
MTTRRFRTRRAIGLGLLLLLLLLIAAAVSDRRGVISRNTQVDAGGGTSAPVRGAGVGGTEGLEPFPLESEDVVSRERLRIWLHDPRWMWWSRTVPPLPYADLRLPDAWLDEVEDSPIWMALVQGKARGIEDAVRAAGPTALETEGPAQAAVFLLATLEVERATHHREWLAAMDAQLAPGETWSSIGADARKQHYEEGRVPAGMGDSMLAADLAEAQALWPDDPYLADLARLIKVHLLLESATSRARWSDAQREDRSVELLDQVEDEGVRSAIAEAIVDRTWRVSMKTVEAVNQAVPQDPDRALNMAMWGLRVATQLQDAEAMARWARTVEERTASFCVNEGSHWRHEKKCPEARSAAMSVQARLAARGANLVPTTWQEAMVTAGWRCARHVGGVRTLIQSTSVVTATWDGSGWQWGSWPDDPGIGECLRNASVVPGPEEPMVVDVTVEVGHE